MKNLIKKYTDRLKVLKDNRAEITDWGNPEDMKLFDKEIELTAEFIRELRRLDDIHSGIVPKRKGTTVHQMVISFTTEGFKENDLIDVEIHNDATEYERKTLERLALSQWIHDNCFSAGYGWTCNNVSMEKQATIKHIAEKISDHKQHQLEAGDHYFCQETKTYIPIWKKRDFEFIEVWQEMRRLQQLVQEIKLLTQ